MITLGDLRGHPRPVPVRPPRAQASYGAPGRHRAAGARRWTAHSHARLIGPPAARKDHPGVAPPK